MFTNPQAQEQEQEQQTQSLAYLDRDSMIQPSENCTFATPHNYYQVMLLTKYSRNTDE